MSGLQLKEVRVEVGSFLLDIPHLESKAGEWVCVMGPSGSGKSTLLNAVAGFLPLSRGEILVSGLRVDTLPPEKRRMGLVFQRPALFPHLNVRQNVEFGLKVQKKDLGGAKDWLQRLEVGELGERHSSQISEGQAQRVALARALAVEFPVLLLDEPFSALDPELRGRLRRDLKAIAKERKLMVWMVTHHPEDAESIADKIIRLEAGQLRG